METTHTTIDIKTVHECNRCLGGKTLHPQASLINLEHPGWKGEAVKFEFYAILLFEDKVAGDSCCCGRRYYDFACATMVFLTPGEMFRMSSTNILPDKGWLLAFHPDLLCRTSLRKHIDDYTFFHYRKEEALHLSQRETTTVTDCLQHIEEELHQPIDSHTATILARHIQLLLDYCTRYYERQFITRENKNKTLLSKMEHLLDGYITAGQLQGGHLPTAEWCAGQLGLSAAYFADLLRMETGKTFAEYFQFKRLHAAKQLLLQPGNTPARVANCLGFPSVQYFTLLFKKLYGIAPGDYRCSVN